MSKELAVDHVLMFGAEMCTIDDGCAITVVDLYKSYRTWCVKRNEHYMTLTMFSVTVRQCFNVKKVRMRITTGQHVCLFGIKLK